MGTNLRCTKIGQTYEANARQMRGKMSLTSAQKTLGENVLAGNSKEMGPSFLVSEIRGMNINFTSITTRVDLKKSRFHATFVCSWSMK